jgi:hypothetical protein
LAPGLLPCVGSTTSGRRRQRERSPGPRLRPSP